MYGEPQTFPKGEMQNMHMEACAIHTMYEAVASHMEACAIHTMTMYEAVASLLAVLVMEIENAESIAGENLGCQWRAIEQI